MTGPEIAGVAKGVVDVATGIGKERSADLVAIRQAARESPGLKAAGEIYGKRVAVRQQIALKLFQPLAMAFGISSSYFQTEFFDELDQKLADVPDEDLQTPKASIAGPAIQGLGYSLDEPSLKELYLNLMASASVKSIADSVHPAFVEVVRQLSAEEVQVLNSVLASRTGVVGSVRIKAINPGATSFNVLETHIFSLAKGDEQVVFPRLATWVTNWERLGLVETTYGNEHLAGEHDYDWVALRPEYVGFKANPPVSEDGTPKAIEFDKGLIVITAFGHAFFSAVQQPVAG